MRHLIPRPTSAKSAEDSGNNYDFDLYLIQLLCEDWVYFSRAPLSSNSRNNSYDTLWEWFSKLESGTLKQVCYCLFWIIYCFRSKIAPKIVVFVFVPEFDFWKILSLLCLEGAAFNIGIANY